MSDAKRNQISIDDFRKKIKGKSLFCLHANGVAQQLTFIALNPAEAFEHMKEALQKGGIYAYRKAQTMEYITFGRDGSDLVFTVEKLEHSFRNNSLMLPPGSPVPVFYIDGDGYDLI